jgi:hypothetical protein
VSVANALVGSSVIMKIAVAMNYMSKPTVTDEPNAVEAFAFQRAEEALDMWIAIGRSMDARSRFYGIFSKKPIVG